MVAMEDLEDTLVVRQVSEVRKFINISRKSSVKCGFAEFYGTSGAFSAILVFS